MNLDSQALGFRAIPATVDCTPVEMELRIRMRGAAEVLNATVGALILKGHLPAPPGSA